MTETRDLIDQLIDELNDGVDGVTFDRDVLETNRPEDWAAVELTGQQAGEWADGTMIDQALTVDIWVCLSDHGSDVKRQVQTVLRGFCQDQEASWQLKARNYLYDLNKVLWRWGLTVWAPLVDPDEDEDDLEEPEEPEDPDDPDEPGDETGDGDD